MVYCKFVNASSRLKVEHERKLSKDVRQGSCKWVSHESVKKQNTQARRKANMFIWRWHDERVRRKAMMHLKVLLVCLIYVARNWMKIFAGTFHRQCICYLHSCWELSLSTSNATWRNFLHESCLWFIGNKGKTRSSFEASQSSKRWASPAANQEVLMPHESHRK